MKKALLYTLSITAGLASIIALLLTGMQTVVFYKTNYTKGYEKYGIYEYVGIAEDDLKEVTNQLLLYMKGDRKDLVMYADIQGENQMVFEEREQAHMVDVLRLFWGGFKIRNISMIIAFVLYLLLIIIYKKMSIRYIFKGYLIAGGIVLALLAAMGIMMVVDFSAVFTQFHYMFFDNDLWLLDPRTDVMIQMFPELFFYDMAIKTAIHCFVFISVPAVAAIIILRKKRA